MRHTLIPHPRHAASAIVTARVELEGPMRLTIEYALSGGLKELAIPRRKASRRADRLWEHTCFEAFVAPACGASYCELNFAPSTQWAAYAFDGYRHGMRPLELEKPPKVEVVTTADELRVTADIELRAFADASLPWRIGLSAVVEDRGGGRAYYALEHPREKPDFHDAAAFTLLLDGSSR